MDSEAAQRWAVAAMADVDRRWGAGDFEMADVFSADVIFESHRSLMGQFDSSDSYASLIANLEATHELFPHARSTVLEVRRASPSSIVVLIRQVLSDDGGNELAQIFVNRIDDGRATRMVILDADADRSAIEVTFDRLCA